MDWQESWFVWLCMSFVTIICTRHSGAAMQMMSGVTHALKVGMVYTSTLSKSRYDHERLQSSTPTKPILSTPRILPPPTS
jgi:hypothetical protein